MNEKMCSKTQNWIKTFSQIPKVQIQMGETIGSYPSQKRKTLHLSLRALKIKAWKSRGILKPS